MCRLKLKKGVTYMKETSGVSLVNGCHYNRISGELIETARGVF